MPYPKMGRLSAYDAERKGQRLGACCGPGCIRVAISFTHSIVIISHLDSMPIVLLRWRFMASHVLRMPMPLTKMAILRTIITRICIGQARMTMHKTVSAMGRRIVANLRRRIACHGRRSMPFVPPIAPARSPLGRWPSITRWDKRRFAMYSKGLHGQCPLSARNVSRGLAQGMGVQNFLSRMLWPYVKHMHAAQRPMAS